MLITNTVVHVQLSFLERITHVAVDLCAGLICRPMSRSLNGETRHNMTYISSHLTRRQTIYVLSYDQRE